MIERCKNCRFWNFNSAGTEGLGRQIADHMREQCRRRSPITSGEEYPNALWPATKGDDWCGDFVTVSSPPFSNLV